MSESFSRDVVRRIIADIARLSGYHSMRQSASDTLGDLLRSYIVNVGYEAVQYASQANRTEGNVFDVAHALQHIGNVQLQHMMEYKSSIVEGLRHQRKAEGEDIDVDNEDAEQVYDLSLFEFDIPKFPVDPREIDNDMKGERGKMGRVDRTMMQLLEKDERELLEEDNDEEAAEEGEPSTSAAATAATAEAMARSGAEASAEGDMDLMMARRRQMSAEQRNLERERKRAAKLWELSLPGYLPQLPPKHTYLDTPVHNERVKSSVQLQKMKSRQNVEASLTQIYERELELREQDRRLQSDERQRKKTRRRKHVEEEWFNMYESLTGMVSRAEELSSYDDELSIEQPFEKRKRVTNPYLVVAKKSSSVSEFEHETDKLFRPWNTVSVPTQNIGHENRASGAESTHPGLVKQPHVFRSSELIERHVDEDYVAGTIASANRKKAEEILNADHTDLVTDSAFSLQ